MGFKVEADPATIAVFKKIAAKAEREQEEFWAFVAAFTKLFEKKPTP